jgi:hypothetical protein
MPVEEQVVVVLAGTGGYLDDVPVEDVRRFEADLLDYVRSRHADLLAHIRTTGELPDDEALEAVVQTFKDEFAPSAAPDAGQDPEAHDHDDAELIPAGGPAEALLPEEEVHREE